MSTGNPYTAPAATVANPTIKVPEAVLKKIKAAWVAGCISGAITLAVTLVSMSGTENLGCKGAWWLVGKLFVIR